MASRYSDSEYDENQVVRSRESLKRKHKRKEKRVKRKKRRVQESSDDSDDKGRYKSDSDIPSARGHGSDGENASSDRWSSGEDEDSCSGHSYESPRPDDEDISSFYNYRICKETMKRLESMGLSCLKPLQYKCFDYVYDGYDCILRGRANASKALSYIIPLAEVILNDDKRSRHPNLRVIIIAGNNERCKAIAHDFHMVSNTLVVLNSCNSTFERQEDILEDGVNVLISTPNRFVDGLKRLPINLSTVQHVVMDDLEKMLDFGHNIDIEAILSRCYSLENKPQMILSVATMSDWLSDARRFMDQDVKVADELSEQDLMASKMIEHLALKCPYNDRQHVIGVVIKVYSGNHGRAMVFCSTRKEADELACSSHIKQEPHVLHSEIPFDKRDLVIQGYREGRFKVLVTTDVGTKGINCPDADLVIQTEPPTASNAYLQRIRYSGRGYKDGISICLFKENQVELLSNIERESGFVFKHIGIPTTEDIIRASAYDACKALDEVSQSTTSLFWTSAERLVEKRGAQQSLAAAMAVISGYTNIKKRSLITNKEGFTTILFTVEIEMRTPGYFWNIINTTLPRTLVGEIFGLRLCSSRKEAVFDVSSEVEGRLLRDCPSKVKYQLSVCNELPKLLPANEQTEMRSLPGRRGRPFRGRGSRNSRKGDFAFRKRKDQMKGNQRSWRGGRRNKEPLRGVRGRPGAGFSVRRKEERISKYNDVSRQSERPVRESVSQRKNENNHAGNYGRTSVSSYKDNSSHRQEKRFSPRRKDRLGNR